MRQLQPSRMGPMGRMRAQPRMGAPGTPGASASAATATIYDGLADYLEHTGGPAGAADGTEFLYVWRGKVESDGSAMTFHEIRNGSGVVLSVRRTATNTIEFKGWDITAATSVFSCVTTGTLTVADSWVTLICSARGTHASVALCKSASTVTGTNTPGTANDLDLTADWRYGALNAASEFLDATVYTHFSDAVYIDAEDAYFQKQFYNAGAMVDIGADGSNPYGSSPLVLHQSGFATHTTNDGTGGNADVGTTFEAGTDPSTSAAITNAFDLLLTAEAWWSADNSENVINGGNVETLMDRGATGNNPTQATAGNRPAKTTAGGVSYADYDGAGDVLIDTSPTAALMGHYDAGGTTLCVVKPNSDGEGNFGRVFSKGDSESIFTANEAAGAVTYDMHFDMDGINFGNLSTTATVSFTDPIILSVRYDKSTADVTTAVVEVNGAAVATTDISSTGTTAETPTGSFHSGDRAAADRSFDGRKYEEAFWDSELSDANQARVDTHMADKYSITLT